VSIGIAGNVFQLYAVVVFNDFQSHYCTKVE
jgi:hypothetical protein